MLRGAAIPVTAVNVRLRHLDVAAHTGTGRRELVVAGTQVAKDVRSMARATWRSALTTTCASDSDALL